MDICNICQEAEASPNRTIAMYEGEVVNETETDEWAGMPVCDYCYETFQRLLIGDRIPTVKEIVDARDARPLDSQDGARTWND